MDRKLVIIFFVGLYVHTADSEFADKVKEMFNNLRGEGLDGCIGTAEQKMKQFTGKNYDFQHAVGIINLYTQDCQTGSSDKWYALLNRQLRLGITESKWKTAGELLNRAICLIGTNTYNVVYRGCMHDPGDLRNSMVYRFKQFISTSRSVGTAAQFGCGGTLYIMRNVKGLYIDPYSDFPGEEEVLLMSTVQFTVAGDPVTDSSEIDTIKRYLKIDTSEDIRRVVYLAWDKDLGMSRVKRGATICERCGICTTSSGHVEEGALVVLVASAMFVHFAVRFTTIQ